MLVNFKCPFSTRESHILCQVLFYFLTLCVFLPVLIFCHALDWFQLSLVTPPPQQSTQVCLLRLCQFIFVLCWSVAAFSLCFSFLWFFFSSHALHWICWLVFGLSSGCCLCLPHSINPCSSTHVIKSLTVLPLNSITLLTQVQCLTLVAPHHSSRSTNHYSQP